MMPQNGNEPMIDYEAVSNLGWAFSIGLSPVESRRLFCKIDAVVTATENRIAQEQATASLGALASREEAARNARSV